MKFGCLVRVLLRRHVTSLRCGAWIYQYLYCHIKPPYVFNVLLVFFLYVWMRDYVGNDANGNKRHDTGEEFT